MLGLVLKAQTAQEVTLAVQGQIADQGVSLLAQEGTRYLQLCLRLVLDLDDVSFIDEAGLALLHRWAGPRLSLQGGSPFLRALLALEGLETH